MSISAPLVSVVMPVYNSSTTLKRSIDSVLNQTMDNFELIIVDDGSKDDSLNIAKSYASADPRITILSIEQNGGKARAMNRAMEIVRGAWIAVIDADDKYLPTRLATLIKAGEDHDVDLVADNQLHTDDATRKVFRQAFQANGSGRAIDIVDFINNSSSSANFSFGILKPIFRTGFVRSNNISYFPSAKLGEDYYLLLDFFCCGGRGWLVHEPLYDWTLPFSPTERRWTNTGTGAWRYDYRNALETNRFYKMKLMDTSQPELISLLSKQEKEYKIMVHYLDAQRAFDTKKIKMALALVVGHPSIWPLLVKRIIGRLVRFKWEH